MGQLAVKSKQAIARPLAVLVPLIQDELQEGNAAGLEHYRQAGELLIEARDQVAEFKWTKWLTKNFALSNRTAYDYIKLAQRIRDNPDLLHTRAETLFSITRPQEQQRDKARRAAFKLHKPVDHYDVERQARAEETRLARLLAIEVIDIGFKVLATRLHKDHGGSDHAMRRLNTVRRELKAVAQTRRFEL